MTKNLARRSFDQDVVLDAAASVFRRRGYGGATTREVAEAAGMHLGSLSYRYRTKDALLLDLMRRALHRVTASVRAAVEGVADPAQRLRAGLRAHLQELISGDDDMYVLLYDWRSLTGLAREGMLRLRGRYEALWDELLADAVAAGYARPGVDPHLVRQFGIGALNWVAQWHDPSDPRTPAEIADAFWEYLAFGLLAEERRRELLGQLTKSRKTKGRRR